jgi:hypothetical protein
MQFHLEVVGDRAAQAYAETLEATTSIEVCGEPSEAVLKMLQRQAGTGVPLTVKRYHLGGIHSRALRFVGRASSDWKCLSAPCQPGDPPTGSRRTGPRVFVSSTARGPDLAAVDRGGGVTRFDRLE